MAAREFVDEDLRGARFVRCDLSGAVLRGIRAETLEIDLGYQGPVTVNGVDVRAYVEGELDRRFPGRELRRATDAEGIRHAWDAVRRAWAAALDRAAAMPAGTVDVSVGGEWSFAQTLRHLVLATDAWLRGAILGVERPFHPLGQPFAEYEQEGDMSVFSTEAPTFEEVLAVRAERQAMVGDVVATVTDDVLAEDRPHPWAPDHRVSVGRCLGVILNEEWEHLRYATRDLDAIAEGRA